MKKFVFVLAIFVLASISIAADEAPPPTPKKSDATKIQLEIKMTPGLDETRMTVSRETLKRLLSADEGMASANSGLGITRAQTVLGGTFLFLSSIFCGLWFIRKRNFAAPRTAVTIVAAAIIVLGTGMVVANVGPPPLTKIDASVFSDKLKGRRGALANIRIEVTEDGEDNRITIMVPANR